MADVQISSPAIVSGQSDYLIAPGVELILKAVNADFDGSGAGGSFLPAVVLTSDSGHVIARALDPSSPVAAGGSAEASFFPGVKQGGAAATALNIPWAIIDSQDGEALAANSVMTFTFATANFNTNDASVFSLRPFSPPFQGIALLQTGVYYVSWWISALVNGNLATPPSSTMLAMAPGSSFTDTFVNGVDLTKTEDYGRIIQGTAPNVNDWDVREVALVGIASVTGQRWVNLGAANRSTTFAFPATGGQGLFGRIFAARLSDGLADYSTFF